MSKSKNQELKEFINKNADMLTPKMLTDIVWCTRHTEEIQKMMGQTPCGPQERYQIENLFLLEGQSSLYFAMRYCDLLGKTEEELLKEEEMKKRFFKNNPVKWKRPYDYDLAFEAEEQSFFEWCDDHDCAVLVRKNQDFERLRLSYIALAIGYIELGAYIASLINPAVLHDVSPEPAEREKLETAWVHHFIEKQPEGERKEELKKKIEQNWPLLKQTGQTASD